MHTVRGLCSYFDGNNAGLWGDGGPQAKGAGGKGACIVLLVFEWGISHISLRGSYLQPAVQSFRHVCVTCSLKLCRNDQFCNRIDVA